MLNEEFAHSRQDAQEFIEDADSYLLSKSYEIGEN
jgi:hypothetical protein